MNKGAHRLGIFVKIDEEREDVRLQETQIREFPAVVLRIRQGEIDDRGQKSQLLPSQPTDPGHLRIERGEEFLGRDIVVKKDFPALEPGESLSQGGRQGKMEDRHVIGSGSREFRERPGFGFKTLITVQAVDPGIKPPRPEEIPHPGGGVPDGVTAMKGRDELVDPHCRDTLSTWSRRIFETVPGEYFSRARS